MRDREILFEEMALRYVNLVFHVAHSWCEDVQEAEELVQETFLRGYVHFSTFAPGTNFKAWILTILRHLYLDTQRKRRLPVISLEGIEEIAERPPNADCEVVDIESGEIFYDLFSDELARLLQTLPKEYQTCLLLCDVEGLRYQEIAEILGCAVGTVRSRIHRGRALLQKQIVKYAKKAGFQELRDEL